MAKQQKLQQYIYKINSTLLAKNNWDLQLPLERSRRVPGLVVSLADSQILTWINEINGTENIDYRAKEIKKKIKDLKNMNPTSENKKMIKKLYNDLYKLQFKSDYVCVIMDKISHYEIANKGFKINGIKYRWLMCTVNGVKTSTAVYINEKLYPELHKRIENNRNVEKELVPAKLGAYQALTSSASVPVSWPKGNIPGGTIVVSDCNVTFKSDFINIDDSDTTAEPIVKPIYDQDFHNNCSDGCGMMLPSLSKRWSEELDNKPGKILSGCNLRNAYTKGMVFTFDFIRFAEEIAGTYIIKDIWGDERDIRDAELIITESQLKLWDSYQSWEDYYTQCINNHYTFRIAKTTPYYEDMDDVRQLNYQFIQPLEIPDEDIEMLVLPTVDEIRDIMGLDYRKSIVYLCGKGLDENTIKYAEPLSQALMIEPELINDSFLRHRIRKMIDKRIKDAKIGVLNVHGNFQILSGDLYALCEHIFNLDVKGLVPGGSIYSKYWLDHGTEKVLCARAPMSNEHSLLSQNICYDKKAQDWFQYIDSAVIVSAWDTMSAALNGFDYDGDLLFTTDNKYMLNNQKNLPALNCIQYKAKKKIVDEDAIIASNIAGFGSKIGAITNRITEMTTLMSKYSSDSEEYKILKYRTQCGQAQQQAEIDKAKGIVSNDMPKSWYVWKENCIQDEDSDEIISKKELYQRVCAHKKPYFFMYNYDYLRSDYLNYIKQANSNCMQIFNMTIDELLSLNEYTDKQLMFVRSYINKYPLDRSPSTMNKICWYLEESFDGVDYFKNVEFDYTILKSNVGYNKRDYNKIKELCQQYKNDVQKSIKIKNKFNDQFLNDEHDAIIDIDQLMLFLKRDIDEAVPNIDIQCDILLDLAYGDGVSKQILWEISGKTIVKNLLKSHNGLISYPSRSIDGEILCGGYRFDMKTVIYGGDIDEEF